MTFSEQEMNVLSILLNSLAHLECEDICGIILKYTGHTILNDSEVVALSRKFDSCSKI